NMGPPTLKCGTNPKRWGYVLLAFAHAVKHRKKGQIGRTPSGNRTIGTFVPAAATGACGGRTTRQSADASKRIIELSCTSNGRASGVPSAARTSLERK